jgi:hypothetical protein
MKIFRNLHLSSLFFIATFLLLATSNVSADYISPGEVSVKTTPYSPQDTDFDLGVYQYDVSWQGIPVAKAHVIVEEKTDSLMNVKATATTGDFISMFYKLRFQSESTFKSESLEPIHFKSEQNENSKEKIREISFSPNGVIRTKYSKDGRVQKPTEFRSENSTFDPISAAFLARSLPIKIGVRRGFDVFNGKHRYLIEFQVEALETISFKGEMIPAYRVRPFVTKLTDSEGEKRLKYARIWISADNKREVLKLESKVLVGKVTAELEAFKPRPSTPRPVVLAADDSPLENLYVSVASARN